MNQLLKPSRRGFIGGLLAAVAAPAIIRTPGLLMPLRRQPLRRDLLSINDITREAVQLFRYSNAFLQQIDSQYEQLFATDIPIRYTNAELEADWQELRIRLPNDIAKDILDAHI